MKEIYVKYVPEKVGNDGRVYYYNGGFYDTDRYNNRSATIEIMKEYKADIAHIVNEDTGQIIYRVKL